MPERAGEHRRLVGEDVAEHVLGDDHVEVGRARRPAASRRCRPACARARRPGNSLARRRSTTSRHRREVSSTLALSTEVDLAAPARGAASNAVRAIRSISATVYAQVSWARSPSRPLVAEVDAAGQLAHDEQVGAGDPLRAQRARVEQRRARPDRAQVGVQAEALAEAEQALLGARRVGVGRVPLRPADGAEQHGVGVAAGLEHLVGERGAVLVDRGAADQALVELELAERVQQPVAPRRRSRGRSRRRGGGRSRGVGTADPATLQASRSRAVDVEPHVVEDQRIVLGSSRLGDERGRSSSGRSPMGPSVTVRRKASGSSGRHRPSASSQQLTSAKPASSRRSRSPRRREVPGFSRPSRGRCRTRRSCRPRRSPRAARRRSPCRRTGRPAGRRRTSDVPAGGAKGSSWSLGIQWKRRVEKTTSTAPRARALGGQPSTESARSPSASRAFSIIVLGGVDAEHPALGQPLAQLGGDAGPSRSRRRARTRRRVSAQRSSTSRPHRYWGSETRS